MTGRSSPLPAGGPCAARLRGCAAPCSPLGSLDHYSKGGSLLGWTPSPAPSLCAAKKPLMEFQPVVCLDWILDGVAASNTISQSPSFENYSALCLAVQLISCIIVDPGAGPVPVESAVESKYLPPFSALQWHSLLSPLNSNRINFEETCCLKWSQWINKSVNY